MKESNKKILSITLRILGATILMSGALVVPALPMLLRQLKPKNNREKAQYRRSIYQLKQAKLISYTRNSSGIKIGLTKKGEREYKFLSLDKIDIKKPETWDGLWRIVTFDIPENKKTVRDALRFKLKDLGFYPYQKSIFVFPYDCKKEIDLIKEFYFAHNYIFLIIAKTLDGEERLKKHFFSNL